jgi:hypothetical protein
MSFIFFSRKLSRRHSQEPDYADVVSIYVCVDLEGLGLRV